MEDLTTSLTERKQTKPKLYREASNEVNAGIISADVAQKRQALMTAAERPKVNLRNLEDVKARTNEFLMACESVSAIPTFLGLCVAFGYSREGLYKYLRSHKGDPSAEFIELTREVLANIMITASLNKAADPATTIFSLKNLHGFADKLQVEPVPPADPLGEKIDRAALEARILESVVDDD